MLFIGGLWQTRYQTSRWDFFSFNRNRDIVAYSQAAHWQNNCMHSVADLGILKEGIILAACKTHWHLMLDKWPGFKRHNTNIMHVLFRLTMFIIILDPFWGKECSVPGHCTSWTLNILVFIWPVRPACDLGYSSKMWFSAIPLYV